MSTLEIALAVLDRKIQKEEEYIRIAVEEDSYAREQGFTFASEQKIEALQEARDEISSLHSLRSSEIPKIASGSRYEIAKEVLTEFANGIGYGSVNIDYYLWLEEKQCTK